MEHDALDERPQGFEGCRTVRSIKSCLQALNPLAINVGQPRVQEGTRARRSLQSSLQFRLPGSELVKFLLKPRGAKTLSDGVDQPVQLPTDCIQLPALGAFVCREPHPGAGSIQR